MSVTLALWILTWVAIVIVYLGLSAVLREVRLLRGQVSRLQQQVSGAAALAPITTPTTPAMPALASQTARVVLVAESGCPLCRILLARLEERSADLRARPGLLSYETAENWDDALAGVDLIRDEQAWSTLAYLQPPVLLLVEPDGELRDLVLPVNAAELDSALTRWDLVLPQPSSAINDPAHLGAST